MPRGRELTEDVCDLIKGMNYARVNVCVIAPYVSRHQNSVANFKKKNTDSYGVISVVVESLLSMVRLNAIFSC